MATTNITRAVIDKFESLAAANFPGATRPRIDFGAPAQVVSGTPLRPPYVRLKDERRESKTIDFERNRLVTTTFALEIYYPLDSDVETAVTAIRLNGGTVGQGSGFDYGTLSLTSPKSTHQILPVEEPRFLATQTDTDGNRVHGCVLRYRVTILEAS